MPIVAPTYLVDTSGLYWQLAVSNPPTNWTTTLVAAKASAVSAILLQDIVTGIVYRITVAPTPAPAGEYPGDLIATVSSSTTSQTKIIVNSPGDGVFAIQMSNGNIVTNPTTCVPLVVGTLYIPNFNGIAWSQPGGPGTTVFPQQNTGPFWLQPNKTYPLLGPPFAEAGQSLWINPCGHGDDVSQVFRDYDCLTGSSAAVVVCSVCSYILRLIEPYQAINNISSYTALPIIIP